MNTSTSGTKPTRKRPRQPTSGSNSHAANPASIPPAGSIVVTQTASDERNRTPGVLRSETRLNWFGGPQKDSEPPTVFKNLRWRLGHCQDRHAILRNWFQS